MYNEQCVYKDVSKIFEIVLAAVNNDGIGKNFEKKNFDNFF